MLCTSSGDVTTVAHQTCGDELGSHEALILMRLKKNDGSLNFIDMTADAHLALGTYVPLLTDVVGKKIQITPILNNPNSEGGDVVNYGGGDETAGGVELAMSSNPIKMTAEFIRIKSETIASLQEYNGRNDLAVLVVNADKEIWGLADDIATPTEVHPIPLESFFVTDKIPGKFSTPDKNNVTWTYPRGYSKRLFGFLPTFVPLRDLTVTV